MVAAVAGGALFLAIVLVGVAAHCALPATLLSHQGRAERPVEPAATPAQPALRALAQLDALQARAERLAATRPFVVDVARSCADACVLGPAQLVFRGGEAECRCRLPGSVRRAR